MIKVASSGHFSKQLHGCFLWRQPSYFIMDPRSYTHVSCFTIQNFKGGDMWLAHITGSSCFPLAALWRPWSCVSADRSLVTHLGTWLISDCCEHLGTISVSLPLKWTEYFSERILGVDMVAVEWKHGLAFPCPVWQCQPPVPIPLAFGCSSLLQHLGGGGWVPDLCARQSCHSALQSTQRCS